MDAHGHGNTSCLLDPGERGRAGWSRWAGTRIAGIFACCAGVLAACDPQSFAPQNASIEVRIDGDPADGVARVTAYVRDALPPHNTLVQDVPVGTSVFFDDLGAGFDIEVGVRNLGTHRCALLGGRRNGLAILDSTTVVQTSSGPPATVAFAVRCRSGAIALAVSGLPPGDSGLVAFQSPVDTVRIPRIRNGSATVHVVPDPAVTIVPDLVHASDGFSYDAAAQTIAVVSGQTAAVTVAYATRAQNQADIVVDLDGQPPNDAGIVLRAFARRVGAPATRDSAPIGFGPSHTFTNVARGVDYDVGVEGLDAYACYVNGATEPYVVAGNAVTVRLRTSTAVPAPANRVGFQVNCRTGTLDLVVSGLPPGDTALVHVDAVFDSATARVANGTTRVHIVPYLLRINPLSVLGSDGRFYDAPFATVNVASRQSATVAVEYSTATCPADQPLAWYPLDGHAADASGNGNHGALQGTAPIQDRNGSANAALSFDGVADRIELGDRFNGLALPFSVTAWVFQPAAARGAFRAILITDDEPDRYAGIWFQIEPMGLPQITYADGGPVGPADRRTLLATDPVPADRWVHIAATVRGPTDMTMYVDGAPVAGTYSGTGGPLVHSAARARIGAITTLPANRPWLGGLDEILIYDCSLDPADVAFLMSRR